MTFAEIGLSPEILQSITESGFETPTPIQEKSIPLILNTENDIKALAQTGTGKTAAFGLPLLEMIEKGVDSVQAIILCPTRELCLQITRDLENFAKYRKWARITPVYGGANIVDQLRKLKSGTEIVVGTPGRVNDLIKRKALRLENTRWMILDEADEMLTMGFKEEIETIIASTPETRRTILFSATMPKDIARLASKYMHDEIEVKAGGSNTTASNVTHLYHMVHEKHRYQVLKRIVDMVPDVYGIVFCRTRQDCKNIADKLMADGYNADALHGDLTQAQRDYVMNRFRTKSLQLLVATDVAARGIDVNNLTHVINYNLPEDPEAYIHRSGRTGRAGKTGISYSIINMKESGKLRSIEKLAKTKFELVPVPNGNEICEKQLMHLIDKVKAVDIEGAHIEPFLPAIYEKLESLDREQLIQHFVSAEFNRFSSYYQNAPDLNVSKKDRKVVDTQLNGDFTRLFINAGRNQNLEVTTVIQLVNRTSRKKVTIGKIDLQRNFSFFEVPTEIAEQVIKKLTGYQFEGNKLEVGVAEGAPKQRTRKKKDGFRRDGQSGGRRNGNSSQGRNRDRSRGDRRRR
ncbi:DEAD/DEAH box helicase [Prolixibacteraceae bacterium JC049]|nr:DEAD/DEAH box helicase [Prolixibacteraceae bacterium JC049]